MTPQEIKKLDLFFKTKFKTSEISVRQRPRKQDSAEVYLGEEFIGILFRDDEEGEVSYNFQMAILDVDLES